MMTLDPLRLAILDQAITACTPAELHVAHTTIASVDDRLPGDFPAHSASVIRAFALLLSGARDAEARRYLDLGLSVDDHVDGSETIADRYGRHTEHTEHTAPEPDEDPPQPS